MVHRRSITVAISRFEDLVARGLRSFIEDDEHLDLVAHDVAHDDLDGVFRTHRPRVALVNFGDLRTPVDVHRLHTAHPETQIVVLASRPTAVEANQMLAFGATACLSKDTQARDVLNAIHLASRGLQVLPRTDGPSSASTNHAEPTGPDLLTPREADVFGHLQQGRSNAEIALALHVSVETVRTHRRNIYRKLGVRTRRELASLSTQQQHRLG
ncbi:DNA-binding response regulator [Paraconexibacter sp.]|uniref:response regulator transcription factor n=1 Tax=Paraconexibacter sp. TaxID=2949640 RepID=UPI003569B962